MSPAAEKLKQQTIARYEYCVEDRVQGFEQKLKMAQAQPDDFWEQLVSQLKHDGI